MGSEFFHNSSRPNSEHPQGPSDGSVLEPPFLAPRFRAIPLVKHIYLGEGSSVGGGESSHPSSSTLELFGPSGGLGATVSLHLIEHSSLERVS